jgi:hypothetical protein
MGFNVFIGLGNRKSFVGGNPGNRLKKPLLHCCITASSTRLTVAVLVSGPALADEPSVATSDLLMRRQKELLLHLQQMPLRSCRLMERVSKKGSRQLAYFSN